ncbi:MAG: hypothetical protein ACAI38_24085 [Myxococcota bacterium]
MTTSVPSVPLRRPGLKGWVAHQRDKSLGWAREQQATGTGYRKKAAETLLEQTELLAQGRSLTRVYRTEERFILQDNGQRELRNVEVVKWIPSVLFAVLAGTFAVGSYFTVFGYIFAAVGAALFAGIAKGARIAKRDDIACTAKRISTLSGMALIPVVGNAFPSLILASELNALAALRKKIAPAS